MPTEYDYERECNEIDKTLDIKKARRELAKTLNQRYKSINNEIEKELLKNSLKEIYNAQLGLCFIILLVISFLFKTAVGMVATWILAGAILFLRKKLK